MDFSFTEEQEAVRGLAKQILEDQVTPERLREVEGGAPAAHFDHRTWEELGRANLLGLSLPEQYGGSGLGFIETCLVLEQVGRSVAYVPVLPSVVMAGLAIAEFGTDAQRGRWLGDIASGALVATAALVEDPLSDAPATTAKRSARSDGWVLDGAKICVPYGQAASLILVPASVVGSGQPQVGIFAVAASDAGLVQEALDTTSGLPESHLTLSGVVVSDADVLGDVSRGRDILKWIRDRTTAALCVTTVGVCEEALRLTADYTKTREQFDKPIASFQAVAQRAAEAYIDTEAVRLTAWQAAWRIDAGLPVAQEVATAKFWAADGGQRVVHAAQHLHGGMGVDRDYPLHRYFLWAKQLELTLGGATAQLLKLGAILADEPVQV